ncbi:basic blue protein-like [Telopea speciosissima]|uniref:basic blue protein-like n=1 Tax=Telopea speciosissima TaxID=54955 RepID=UPI001CC770BD|nr:basic blue protein-like [Telopea speciosissima]
MAPQGRDNAKQVTVTTIALLLCIFIPFKIAYAATYIVGDSLGWNFNVRDWPSEKTFTVGDTLVFNYDTSLHNVVEVDIHGYNNCQVSSRFKTFTSGNDSIKLLAAGHNYFICGFSGHCNKGMKIDINVI